MRQPTPAPNATRIPSRIADTVLAGRLTINKVRLCQRRMSAALAAISLLLTALANGRAGNITTAKVGQGGPHLTASSSPVLPAIAPGAIALKFVTVATGLTAPLEISSPADGTGRLFVVQQTGQVRIVKNGNLNPTPFLDVSGRLVSIMPSYDERGLLGFAFHPDFNDSSAPGFHKIYTYTSEPVSGPSDFTVMFGILCPGRTFNFSTRTCVEGGLRSMI